MTDEELLCPYCGAPLKVEKSRQTGKYSVWCPHNCDRGSAHCFYLGGYPTIDEIRGLVRGVRVRGSAA